MCRKLRNGGNQNGGDDQTEIGGLERR